MTTSLFRVQLPDGSARLARGSVADGPATLLPVGVTLDGLLGDGQESLWGRVAAMDAGGVPEGCDLSVITIAGLGTLHNPVIAVGEPDAAGVGPEPSGEAAPAPAEERSARDSELTLTATT